VLVPSLFPLDAAQGQELEAAVEGLVTGPSRDRCPGKGRGPRLTHTWIHPLGPGGAAAAVIATREQPACPVILLLTWFH
jgi:hypothetical protein